MHDDVVALVCHMAGINEQDEDYIDQVEDYLFGLELDIESLVAAVKLIMSYIPAMEAPVSGRYYHCLGVDDGKRFTAFVKQEKV